MWMDKRNKINFIYMLCCFSNHVFLVNQIDGVATACIFRSHTPKVEKKTPISAHRKRKLSGAQTSSTAGKNNKEKVEKKADAKKPKLDMKKALITMPSTPSFLR